MGLLGPRRRVAAHEHVRGAGISGRVVVRSSGGDGPLVRIFPVGAHHHRVAVHGDAVTEVVPAVSVVRLEVGLHKRDTSDTV